MKMAATFNFPTDIRIGQDIASIIPKILHDRGFTRPLYVTDSDIEKLPFFSRILDQARQAGLTVSAFSQIFGNPTAKMVHLGEAIYKDENCDSLVIIGGGAALDVGKAIAVAVTHSGNILSYAEGSQGPEITAKMPFKMAIPTTAGTGSEVGRSSVISDDGDNKKYIIFSPQMMPEIVLIDPILTLGLPQKTSVTTGMDALTHSIEAYLSLGYHPLCDGIAIEAVKIIATHLPIVFKDPNNIDARTQMLVGALMGATAFQKGLGVTHSCAHALSTHFDMHHGLANTLMLPACLAFNEDKCLEQYQRIMQVIPHNSSQPDLQSWVSGFAKSLGIEPGLKNHGIQLTDALFQTAFEDPCHQQNPKPVTYEDIKTIFLKAS